MPPAPAGNSPQAVRDAHELSPEETKELHQVLLHLWEPDETGDDEGDDEDVRQKAQEAERQEMGDGGSSSPNEGTSVFGEAPSQDEEVRKEMQLRLRMVRRARRVRMEIAWGLLHELPATTLGVSRDWSPFLKNMRRMSRQVRRVVEITDRLVASGIYYPSNRSVLEMTLILAVVGRMTGPLQLMDMGIPPRARAESLHAKFSKLRDLMDEVSGEFLPDLSRFVSAQTAQPALIRSLLEGSHGVLVQSSSGDSLSPWHRLLELAIAMVSELGFGAIHSYRLDPDEQKKLSRLWNALESACRTLYPKEWAYAGEAVSAIPSIIGLDLRG